MLVCKIPPGLAVLRHEHIEIGERGNPLRYAIGDARGNHAAIAVGAQDHLGEVLAGEKLHDVGNMRVEIDIRAGWCRRAESLSRPLKVTAWASWPARLSRATKSAKVQPPRQPPGIKTKLAIETLAIAMLKAVLRSSAVVVYQTCQGRPARLHKPTSPPMNAPTAHPDPPLPFRPTSTRRCFRWARTRRPTRRSPPRACGSRRFWARTCWWCRARRCGRCRRRPSATSTTICGRDI